MIDRQPQTSLKQYVSDEIGADNAIRETLITQIISSRRSIRSYLADPVSPNIVEHILQLAAYAPSAHNRQPWRFVVLVRIEQKTKLANSMGDRLKVDRLRDGDALEKITADVARSHQRIVSAPVVVVVCMDCAEMDCYVDSHRSIAERTMAIQSTAAAIQNLLLAASSLGIGASWMCAPLFCADAVVATLGLPDGWEPQAVITLGYPANAGRPKYRRPLNEFIFHLAD